MEALLVEDRETAYLFADRKTAPPEAKPCEVHLSVPPQDIENESVALWLSNADGTVLKVVPFAGYDFGAITAENEFVPIPTPLFVADNEEYERLQAE